MDRPEIKITGVAPKIKEELTNIAKNSGLTVSSFLKPKIKDIVDSYPPEMKIKSKFD